MCDQVDFFFGLFLLKKTFFLHKVDRTKYYIYFYYSIYISNVAKITAQTPFQFRETALHRTRTPPLQAKDQRSQPLPWGDHETGRRRKERDPHQAQELLRGHGAVQRGEPSLDGQVLWRAGRRREQDQQARQEASVQGGSDQGRLPRGSRDQPPARPQVLQGRRGQHPDRPVRCDHRDGRAQAFQRGHDEERERCHARRGASRPQARRGVPPVPGEDGLLPEEPGGGQGIRPKVPKVAQDPPRCPSARGHRARVQERGGAEKVRVRKDSESGRLKEAA